MKVLVDTSVWIDYFRSGKATGLLDDLIDSSVVVTNNLILTELIPSLRVAGQVKVIKKLEALKAYEIAVNWREIMWVQYQCLKSGHNGIGIPDLMIGQNAGQNECHVWSLDGHFQILARKFGFQLLVDKAP